MKKIEGLADLLFLEKGAVEAAKQLIGYRFYKYNAGELIGGKIVETEAYTGEDAASHAYKGRTPRNDIMFGPAGNMYVYFTYGMHYCANIVTGKAGYGEGVLLRALQPDSGLEVIRERRKSKPDNELTDGPAKLCQALDITLKDLGKKLNDGEFVLLAPKDPLSKSIATKRIGITKDTHRLWRFIIDE